MTDTQTSVLEKIRKLLRLSQSENVNEAALAASKAQELMDAHKLTQASLDAGDASIEPDEPVQAFRGAALDPSARRPRWYVNLAVSVARANDCGIYLSGGVLHLYGRASDAETVRYLYGYLSKEVERLLDQHGRGMGMVWRNNYAAGAVEAIGKNLNDARDTARRRFRDQMTAAHGETALVRVDQALAKIDQRAKDLVIFAKESLRLRAGRSHRSGGFIPRLARWDGSTARPSPWAEVAGSCRAAARHFEASGVRRCRSGRSRSGIERTALEPTIRRTTMNQTAGTALSTLLARGFDHSTRTGHYRHDGAVYFRVACSQCAALVINNVPTHERGCQNATHECAGCMSQIPARWTYCESCG